MLTKKLSKASDSLLRDVVFVSCLLAPTQPLSHWRKALQDLSLIKEMNIDV